MTKSTRKSRSHVTSVCTYRTSLSPLLSPPSFSLLLLTGTSIAAALQTGIRTEKDHLESSPSFSFCFVSTDCLKRGTERKKETKQRGGEGKTKRDRKKKKNATHRKIKEQAFFSCYCLLLFSSFLRVRFVSCTFLKEVRRGEADPPRDRKMVPFFFLEQNNFLM